MVANQDLSKSLNETNSPPIRAWQALAESTKRLIGQNYTTPDLVAKVTGRARFSDDYRVDGMLFAKLLLSPMPHARVTRFFFFDARACA